jgi:Holliday junction resolvasome RuvABC endonuclease subunit
MRLLAIDPGNEETGWVFFDTATNKILEFRKECNEKVLFSVERLDPDETVIERIASYGMAVGESVFLTCFFIGRLIERASTCGPVHLITRKEVVVQLCGTARAKDSNIRQVLIDRFGEPGTKKNPGPTYGIKADMWAALAVAVAWTELHLEERNEQK